MSLHIPSHGDHAVAVRYWADHEWKKFAVDVIAGSAKKSTYAQTWYARARSAEAAIACIKRQGLGLPSRAQYKARLAGPNELGCVPSCQEEFRG